MANPLQDARQDSIKHGEFAGRGQADAPEIGAPPLLAIRHLAGEDGGEPGRIHAGAPEDARPDVLQLEVNRERQRAVRIRD